MVVITDGQRVTGLGDLGVQGMGTAVGKATLLTSLGGLDPSDVLPICIDVGTDNEALLKDKFYIGSRRKRIVGDDYDDLIDEVVQGIKRRFGQRTLFFFEEFSNRNAKRMLDRYTRNSVALVDDLQCIATTVLAALISALSQVQGSLLDQRFLFTGAGETGTYAADLLASYIAQQHGISLPQARKNIFFIDRKGLVTRQRAETEDDLELHKLPYAHDIADGGGSSVLEAVKLIKPTALIGIRRHRFSFFEGSVLKDEKLFTADVLREMAECSERPIIMALSRPAALHECTAAEAYEATDGKCIFVGGCRSPPFEHNGKDVAPSECTTEYVFPGLALGMTIAEGTRVRESILIEVAETVAESASHEDIDHGAIAVDDGDLVRPERHEEARSVAIEQHEPRLRFAVYPDRVDDRRIRRVDPVQNSVARHPCSAVGRSDHAVSGIVDACEPLEAKRVGRVGVDDRRGQVVIRCGASEGQKQQQQSRVPCHVRPPGRTHA